jgi:hypothetical protein
MAGYVPKSKRKGDFHAHRGPGGTCLRGQKYWIAERQDWKHIAEEFDRYPGTMGKFHFHLCHAIQVADIAGTERLRKAYPELVALIRGD